MTHASEKRILVVDDEPDVRDFVAAILEDAGFMVDTAQDGVDAMDIIKDKFLPDLITLDMVMPRKSGIQFLRELRTMGEPFSQLPVVVITAHARDEFGSKDVKELTAFATRQQPKVVIEKPITPHKLVDAIAEILRVEYDPFDDDE